MSLATISAWITNATSKIRRSQSPRLDARVLAKWALKLDDAGLIAEECRKLNPEELEILEGALARRVAGEPVAYITGEKEFWGLTIQCRPPMLLPRPDSETLIAAAVKRRAKTAPLRILDLGTGTGCLLVAALKEFPTAHGIGVDYLPESVALARTNVDALGLAARAEIRQGSWTEGLEGAFDLILSNPPYIPEAESETLDPGIREYEDPRALFAGADGLSAYRTIFAGALPLMAQRGLIIVELGFGQAETVTALAAAAFPDAAIAVDPDLGGRPRALVADCAEKTV